MLTAGQPVHEVSRYLGHRPQVLLISYSHVLRGRHEHVASSMSALLDPPRASEAKSERSLRRANDEIGPRAPEPEHLRHKLRDSLGDQPGLNR
jgi:hypothetical protein